MSPKSPPEKGREFISVTRDPKQNFEIKRHKPVSYQGARWFNRAMYNYLILSKVV